MASLLTDILFPRLGEKKRATEVRVANPLFDPGFYASKYPHVVKGKIDLHDHYSYYGCRNGYDPNPYFDSAWYLGANEDVGASGANPLDHYLVKGVLEGRNPSPRFSTWLYLILYPDVRQAGLNPLLHFLTVGESEGRCAPPVALVPSWNELHDGLQGSGAPLPPNARDLAIGLRERCDRLLDAQRSG